MDLFLLFVDWWLCVKNWANSGHFLDKVDAYNLIFFKYNKSAKSKMFMKVKLLLIFQMGKFYEFFHMDAAVGVNELGLLYMKVCSALLASLGCFHNRVRSFATGDKSPNRGVLVIMRTKLKLCDRDQFSIRFRRETTPMQDFQK